MSVTTDQAVPGPSAARRPQGYLHGPVVDFLCLGGGSLPILCLLLMLPPAEYRPSVMLTVFLASHVVNNPHFIHSYQIFYDGFGSKIAPGAVLRRRYLLAGVAVPLGMAGFFAWCLATGDAVLMGKAMNLMLLTVGWHYVKQGYGILIVESVMKRAFLDQRGKDWLRWNTFAVWIASWIWANQAVREAELWGIQYFSLALPGWLLWLAAGAAAVTTLASVLVLARKAMAGPLPWNGVLAYVTSSYVWIVLVPTEPLLLAVVPVFHSLQYLAVVYRYQLNRSAVEDGPPVLGIPRPRFMVAKFAVAGIVLGFIAFWAMPVVLDAALAYREEIFGPTVFMFMFFTFINVHHYFLDNVMWRKENPDIKEHLFK